MNTRYITLGTFVLVTLGAFGWLAFQLGLGDRGGTHYTVRTPDAAGLVEGNSVRIAGVEVGKVERILVDGNEAVIDVRVRNGTRVFADACAAVHIKGMLGEKYLGITQDKQGADMPANATFGCVTATVDFDNALNATRDMVYGDDALLPVVTRIAHRIDEATAALDAPPEPSVAPTAPGDAPPAAKPSAMNRLDKMLDDTGELIALTRDTLAENRDDLRAIIKGTRALVEDPRIPRMLANGDKLLDTVSRRAPKLLDELEDILAKLDRGLELVDDKHRARFDAMIADASVGLANLRSVSEEFKGVGKELRPLIKNIGPLLNNLSKLAERAAGITEASIRQFFQMEGFRVRLGQGREARRYMQAHPQGSDADDSASGDD